MKLNNKILRILQNQKLHYPVLNLSYYVVSSNFLQYGPAWTREPGKVIFGNVYAVVGWLWISLMAYTRDQLINFRTAGVYIVPRPVRKTLFRLHLWNPRRHRVPRIPGPPSESVSTRGRSPGFPSGMPRAFTPRQLRPMANHQGACLRGLRKRRPSRLPAVVLRLRAASPSPASTRARYETSRPMCAISVLQFAV